MATLEERLNNIEDLRAVLEIVGLPFRNPAITAKDIINTNDTSAVVSIEAAWSTLKNKRDKRSIRESKKLLGNKDLKACGEVIALVIGGNVMASTPEATRDAMDIAFSDIREALEKGRIIKSKNMIEAIVDPSYTDLKQELLDEIEALGY